MGKKRKRPGPPLKVLLGALGLLAVLGLLAFLLWPRKSGAGGAPQGRDRLETRAGTVPVSFLFSADLQGRLVPTACQEGSLGGVARMAAVYRAWAAERPDHVIVDIGNATVTEHNAADEINRLALRALDKMGCAVVNCGPNEAALSLDRLMALPEGLKLKMISANLVRAGTQKTVFDPYAIVEVKDRRIGFIGLVSQDISPRQPGKGIRILPTWEALRGTIGAIQDKVDLIVVLAYLLPKPQDEKEPKAREDELYGLVRKFSNVNLYLGGGAEASSAPYELAGHTLIAYLSDMGCTVARLDDPAFPKDRPPSAVGRATLLDPRIQDDAGMAAIVADFKAALGSEKPPGANWDVQMPCTTSYVGSVVCMHCHLKEYYAWQKTNHAGAYATLLQEDAKREEKGRGKDETPYIKSPKCLVCHSTGYRMPAGYDPARLEERAAQAKAQAKEGGKEGEKEPPILATGGLKRVPTTRQENLKGVGCECCHGGALRHLGMAIKARIEVVRAPQLRSGAAARTCQRCHNPGRPCLEPGKYDPFEYDRDEYFKKIQRDHWKTPSS